MARLSLIAFAILPSAALTAVLAWQHHTTLEPVVEQKVERHYLATVTPLESKTLEPLQSFQKLALQKGTSKPKASAASKSKTVAAVANNNDQGFDLDDLDLSQLSPELASRVESLMAEPIADEPIQQSASQSSDVVALLDNIDAYKGKLPAINLQTHMYVSAEANRWVKANDKEIHQGEWLTPQVQLTSITPRTVIVNFEGQAIEIPALYEWK